MWSAGERNEKVGRGGVHGRVRRGGFRLLWGREAHVPFPWDAVRELTFDLSGEHLQ